MDVLARLGVTTEMLPDQYGKQEVPGRTLILDGDGPAYVAAAKAKRLDTAIRQYHTMMLTEMFMTNAVDLEVHLTSSRCEKFGRHKVLASKPYQGNRVNKDKPPLLEPLRHALTLPQNWLPNMQVELHSVHEADDAMIMRAHQLKDNGVVWSDDKDLRCTPYPYYEKRTSLVMAGDPVGQLWEYFTPGGDLRIEGQGPMFFWCQMLMGDDADNVKGIEKFYGKLCGKAAAYKALKDCKTVQEAANLVLDAYRFSGQNVLAEGWMLHLLRFPGDNFWHYAHECDLSPENQLFMQECAKQRWRLRNGEKRDHAKGKWTSDIYTV